MTEDPEIELLPDAPPAAHEYPNNADLAEQRRWWCYCEMDRPGIDIAKVIEEADLLRAYIEFGTVPAGKGRAHLKEVKP